VKPSNGIEHDWLGDGDPPSRQLFPSRHHPSGAERRFNEDHVKQRVLEWQRCPSPELANSILVSAEPLIRGVVASRGTHPQQFEEAVGITEIPMVTTKDLRGTRQFALARYADQLLPEDFSRLIFLTRNLSPSAIIPDSNGLGLTLAYD
jgi:hypothetical protein